MFSAKGLTPIDRQLSKKVVKIIHGLLMMEESAPFRKPVAHKALGLEDYKLIVKKPTDLNLIRRQNNEGKYKFVQEILDEIQLCWDNCKLYNAIGSEIYNQSLYMETAFDKFGWQILPDYWKDMNREEYNGKFNEKKLEEEKLKKPEQKSNNKKFNIPVSSQFPSSEQQRHRIKKTVNFSAKPVIDQIEPQEEIVEQGSEQKQDKNQKQYMAQMQAPYVQPSEQINLDKGSMDIEEGDEIQEIAVEPIMVNLSESPTRQQLLELSEFIKNLYLQSQFVILEKVLEILHSNEKENMSLNKNGMMSFKMNKIHVSTYFRIKKLVGMTEQTLPLIE